MLRKSKQNSSFYIHSMKLSTSLFLFDLPTGTCNANTPCVNAACCAANCTSNCKAKAECGQYGVSGKQNCPLGVCCSQFGFCDSTDDFCNTGCQAGFGGCGSPKRPSCGGGNSAGKISIGYYDSWSNTRQCQSTWISVGGWSFTDPGPTRTAFSTMSSTSANRKAYIDGLIKFMNTYGFDGVDLDWEYPQAGDRGGATADTANYVSLVKDMRTAFGTKYGITVTLPTSYWYLQHFDLVNMQSSVDWFNLMSYDLHGVWDAESRNIGPYRLDLLWRAGIIPAKVVLGQVRSKLHPQRPILQHPGWKMSV
ncbi:family 18 glycosyl hydrolase [Rhexocercosporidium sp. MPI-PUGE-AT-0058]|nr:family 18 glycosyl hydrolase [Rhexocercosporidium sp. MPI-PUGE-AT-0058]